MNTFRFAASITPNSRRCIRSKAYAVSANIAIKNMRVCVDVCLGVCGRMNVLGSSTLATAQLFTNISGECIMNAVSVCAPPIALEHFGIVHQGCVVGVCTNECTVGARNRNGLRLCVHPRDSVVRVYVPRSRIRYECIVCVCVCVCTTDARCDRCLILSEPITVASTIRRATCTPR